MRATPFFFSIGPIKFFTYDVVILVGIANANLSYLEKGFHDWNVG